VSLRAPRDVPAKTRVLGPIPRDQRRLFVDLHKDVEGERHERAIHQETPVAEEERLTQDDGDDGGVHGIAHEAIETFHDELLRRRDRRRMEPRMAIGNVRLPSESQAVWRTSENITLALGPESCVAKGMLETTTGFLDVSGLFSSLQELSPVYNVL